MLKALGCLRLWSGGGDWPPATAACRTPFPGTLGLMSSCWLKWLPACSHAWATQHACPGLQPVRGETRATATAGGMYCDRGHVEEVLMTVRGR